MQISGISDIRHCFYINLARRLDRRQHAEQQLRNILLNPNCVQRFHAVENTANGAIGCTMSHIRCLMEAKLHGFPHVLICEDDILFTDPLKFRQYFEGCMHDINTNAGGNWDVIILAGAVRKLQGAIGPHCAQVEACQTTTGYLVNAHYYDTLIYNFTHGLAQLMANPSQHRHFALDIYWMHLQATDRWFIVMPLSVIQRNDYSDIEKKQANYKKCMLTFK